MNHFQLVYIIFNLFNHFQSRILPPGGPDSPSVSVRRPRPPAQPPRFTRVRRKQEKTVTSWTYIRSRMDYRDSQSQVMGVSAISFLLLAFCVHFSGLVCTSYTRSGEHRAASSSYTKPLPRQFIPFSSPLPFLLLDFAVGPKSIQHSIGYLWHLWWGKKSVAVSTL